MGCASSAGASQQSDRSTSGNAGNNQSANKTQNGADTTNTDNSNNNGTKNNSPAAGNNNANGKTATAATTSTAVLPPSKSPASGTTNNTNNNVGNSPNDAGQGNGRRASVDSNKANGSTDSAFAASGGDPANRSEPFSPSDDSSDSSGPLDVPRTRVRSKSIAIMEHLSAGRTREREELSSNALSEVAHEKEGEFTIVVTEPRNEIDERLLQISTKSRQRRLSSVFNDFSSQVEAFLLKSAAAGGTGSPGNGFLHSGSSNSGSSSTTSLGDDANSSTSQEPGGDLRRIFDTLDLQGTQTITLANLREGFRRMGYKNTNQELDTMFRVADSNNDGLLEWKEFQRFFKHLSRVDSVNAEDFDEATALALRRRTRTESIFVVSAGFRSYRIRQLMMTKARVKAVDISPNRALFACCDRDEKIVGIYDYNTTKRVRNLSGHRDSMLMVAFNVDKKVVATCSRDCTLTLWDMSVGHELGVLQHPGVVTCCAFSADGRYIYSGCQDNLVRKFAVSKARFIRVMQHMPSATLGVIVALGPQQHANDRILMCRSCETTVHVLDQGTLRPTAVLEGHKTMVWHCLYDSDGTYMLTNCEKEVRVWSASTCICLHTFPSVYNHPAKCGLPSNKRPKLWTTAVFCPSQFGRAIVAFNTDTSIFVYNVESGKLILNLSGRSAVYCAAAGVETPVIVCGDDLGNVFSLELS